MRLHLYGVLGFAIAQTLIKPSSVRSAVQFRDASMIPVEVGLTLREGLAATITFGCFMLFINALLGRLNYSFSNILTPYGFEDAESYMSTGLHHTFAYFGFYTGVFVLVYWNRWIERVNATIMRIIYSMIGLNLIFWLMRGSRNMFVLMLFPLIVIVLYRKKIKLIRYTVFGAAALVAMYFVASFRNIGLKNIGASDVREVASSLDIYSGELGTSYSVLDKTLMTGFDRHKQYGYTYTVGVAVNLVPRDLWPNRPDNLAVEFSKHFFDTNNLSEGLGFSPVAEAIINFGELGVIPVFFVSLAITMMIESWLTKRVTLGFVALACAVPMVFNWNRIDLATVVKMYSGFALMILIFRVTCLRHRVPQRGTSQKSSPRFIPRFETVVRGSYLSGRVPKPDHSMTDQHRP